VQNLIFCSCKI